MPSTMRAALCPSPRCSRSSEAARQRGRGGPPAGPGSGRGTQRGVHRPALDGGAGRCPGEQLDGPREVRRVDEVAEIRRSALTQPSCRAAIAASGVVVLHTFGMWRATSLGAKLSKSAWTTLGGHRAAERGSPAGEVGVPEVGEPEGEHRLVGVIGGVGDDPDRLDEVQHPASERSHGARRWWFVGADHPLPGLDVLTDLVLGVRLSVFRRRRRLFRKVSSCQAGGMSRGPLDELDPVAVGIGEPASSRSPSEPSGELGWLGVDAACAARSSDGGVQVLDLDDEVVEAAAGRPRPASGSWTSSRLTNRSSGSFSIVRLPNSVSGTVPTTSYPRLS